MSLPLQKHESFIQEGAGASTATWTATSAGLYRAYLSATYGAGSTIAGTVVQSGSVAATMTLPSAVGAMTHSEINQLFTMASGDILTLTVTSSDPTNSVKSLFVVNQMNSGI